jgi:DNA-binding MarR family transcriptional regulator
MSNAGDISFAATHHIRDHCLCLHAQRAARVLARRFDEALRPLGLTNGQFSLLNALNRPTPTRMASITTLLAMDRTTLTAALKPLERRGLIEVTGDPDDGRSKLFALTRAGRILLARAVPIWKATHGGIEDRVGDADRLRRDLRTLVPPI